jgi:hypothetical protein
MWTRAAVQPCCFCDPVVAHRIGDGVLNWAKQHGVRSLSLLEADLVVTNRALCYGPELLNVS